MWVGGRGALHQLGLVHVTVLAFEEQGFLVFASRGLVLDSGIMTYICTVKSHYQDHLR